jgi:hypothetical protein
MLVAVHGREYLQAQQEKELNRKHKHKHKVLITELALPGSGLPTQLCQRDATHGDQIQCYRRWHEWDYVAWHESGSEWPSISWPLALDSCDCFIYKAGQKSVSKGIQQLFTLFLDFIPKRAEGHSCVYMGKTQVSGNKIAKVLFGMLKTEKHLRRYELYSDRWLQCRPKFRWRLALFTMFRKMWFLNTSVRIHSPSSSFRQTQP